ncbi:hypothetical protein R77592_04436 [Ralstonia mannitolilytica]|uniref:hypothetical protein n=1 Tax=Ralstonia mannitolilytica TaxID=105219 RepID=UPI0028F6B083|nr:hypothetical protein [Ralstonia mannitolilytica]CAJ0737791.1 hypothetical protein R77592_04436 [Ralstonia mannitolilytica]
MRFAPKDERIYFYQRGKPLGEWEREHRLHIDQPASDEIFEIGNVYRIDSTCLEITDESAQSRFQWKRFMSDGEHGAKGDGVDA